MSALVVDGTQERGQYKVPDSTRTGKRMLAMSLFHARLIVSFSFDLFHRFNGIKTIHHRYMTVDGLYGFDCVSCERWIPKPGNGSDAFKEPI